MLGEEKAAECPRLQSSHIKCLGGSSLVGAFRQFLHRFPSPDYNTSPTLVRRGPNCDIFTSTIKDPCGGGHA